MLIRYDYTDFFDTNTIPRLFFKIRISDIDPETLTKFPNTDTLFPRPIFLQRYRDPQKWQKPRNRDVTWQAGKRLHQYIEKGQTSDNPLIVFDVAKVCLLNTII